MASRATTRDVDDDGALFPRCVVPTRARPRRASTRRRRDEDATRARRLTRRNDETTRAA
jgi:hypothetical protein